MPVSRSPMAEGCTTKKTRGKSMLEVHNVYKIPTQGEERKKKGMIVGEADIYMAWERLMQGAERQERGEK
jgi:hypothetical protein